MLRTELLGVLKGVAPALAQKPTLPVLSHLCFDGDWVYAYDDAVVLRAKSPLGPWEGAIQGGTLLAMLGSSRAEEVSFGASGQEVTFKMGRTRAKFASLPPTDFLFKEPSMKGVTIPVDVAFRSGLSIASRSSGDDASSGGSRIGITLVFGRKKLEMFSTDNVTVCRVSIAYKSAGMDGKIVSLSERFYKLLDKLVDAKLVFTDAGDVIGIGEGLELFGKVRKDANPDQFVRVFDDAGLDTVPRADIPAGLGRCLDRASAISKESTDLSYSGGRLSMLTTGQGCEVQDSVKIDLGEDPIEVCTCAEYLHRYMDRATRIGIGPKCMVLEGESFQVLVGVKTNKTKSAK